MTKNEYINSLVSAFNTCKEIIKKGKREIIISEHDYTRKELEIIIPPFEKCEGIKIHSIPDYESLYSEYIHLSGVNVLFYICCLYLRLIDSNHGKYHEYTSIDKSKKINEKINVLRRCSFIFEENEKGFWYYPIKDLKNTNKFVFDLPPLKKKHLIKGRK